MFERQGDDRLTVLGAAADAGEGDDGADVGTAARERRGLRGGIEILLLQTHGHLRLLGGVFYPRVMGGKNAISLAPAKPVSARTWLRSMAARMTRGFSNAWAYSSPRRASHIISSPTVVTPAGGSMSSSGFPTRSRTQAK